MTGPADQLLFAYGALASPEVQLDTFGRLIAFEADVLTGHTLDYADTEDPRDANPGGTTILPILRRTGNARDKVIGKLLLVTADEVDAADEFQMPLYRRTSVTLASGRTAWVYIGGPGAGR